MLQDFLITFLIILGIQVVFFIYAVIKKTDIVTDISYGLTFIISVISSYILNINNQNIFTTILVILVTLWGIRISTYLFIRILNIKKDKRFDGVREVPIKFAMFWILQAVSIFIILLPATYIIYSNFDMTLNIFAYIGGVLAIFGLIVETIADQQKYVFKNIKENKDRFISTGLWKYSRHPNYLGEILFWVGIFIYCIIYLNDLALLTIISPIYITYLLTSLSGIPTLEKKYDVKYKNNMEYQEYRKSTGVLFPKVI